MARKVETSRDVGGMEILDSPKPPATHKKGKKVTKSEEPKVDKKQGNQLLRWFFTFNNYVPSDIEILETCFNKICKRYIFQEETGEKTGTRHLQGCIELWKKMRWSEFGLSKKIRWEKTRNKNAAEEYCAKTLTRTGKTFVKGIHIPVPVETITELYPFQKDLLEICTSKPLPGKIHWVYDEKGQIGKTAFVRYMNIKHKVPFCYGGKQADIINLAFNNKKYLTSTDKPCFIYNFGRDVEREKISYASMEALSDGCIANTKFEAGCFVFNCPNIIVLSNTYPLFKKMTSKRWMLYTVDDNGLILQDIKAFQRKLEVETFGED